MPAGDTRDPRHRNHDTACGHGLTMLGDAHLIALKLEYRQRGRLSPNVPRRIVRLTGKIRLETINTNSTKPDDAIWRDWLSAVRRPGVGAVVLLTIIGGVLRFIALERPPLLFDEAATYTRVTGSFQELLDILRFDGFAPLHYEMDWLIGRFAMLTPFVMRLIPAIAGTLMIPAMYFLARQVAGKRIATLSAGLAAFSAYLLVYSRDAKMYMHLWLFAVLFIASMLWWMRSGKRIAWLAWVAAGAAMNGLHALGLCVVGVAMVIVLMHPLLTRRKMALAILGMVLACAGIAGHYAFFNQFGKKIESGGWRSSGLDWIGQRNRQFSKPFILWDTAASWLLAYRSPRPPITPPNRVIVPVAIVSAILGALLIAGIMPWPRRLRDDEPDDAPVEAQHGRGAMWMAAWVLLPTIGFYIISFVIGKHDVFNARYLAIVWPAVMVPVAMAIQRLPAPWLRAGAIALFIGANLLQFTLRMTVQNGVPVDEIARDVAAAKNSDGDLRTIVAVKDDPNATSLGGNGGVFDFPGRYYLAIELGKHVRPKQLRDEPFRTSFDVPTDLHNIPASVSRLIVWTDVDKKEAAVLATLGKDWTRKSSQIMRVHDFWCWRSIFRCQRSVYVRK